MATLLTFVSQAFSYAHDNPSVVIALCALGLTIYQASVTRRHNRLSVTPHIQIFTERSLSKGIGTISVSILNNGLGPALFESYELLLVEQPIDVGDITSVELALSQRLGRTLTVVSLANLIGAHSMRRDESRVVLSVQLSCKDHNEFKDFGDSFIRQVNIAITYRSLYQSRFVYDSRQSDR